MFATSSAVWNGSSPLTRGKPPSAARRADSPRLIPAHAGKTRARPQHRGAIRAHPRSRGENHFESLSSLFVSGSSPLTRGKPGVGLFPCLVLRLIPAHAGKTVRALVSREVKPAHPRSRGENLAAIAKQTGRRGSSPLTRGKPTVSDLDVPIGGLIPAHAGKT